MKKICNSINWIFLIQHFKRRKFDWQFYIHNMFLLEGFWLNRLLFPFIFIVFKLLNSYILAGVILFILLSQIIPFEAIRSFHYLSSCRYQKFWIVLIAIQFIQFWISRLRCLSIRKIRDDLRKWMKKTARWKKKFKLYLVFFHHSHFIYCVPNDIHFCKYIGYTENLD